MKTIAQWAGDIWENCGDPQDDWDNWIGPIIADIRNEALGEAAKVCDAAMARMRFAGARVAEVSLQGASESIRALKEKRAH